MEGIQEEVLLSWLKTEDKPWLTTRHFPEVIPIHEPTLVIISHWGAYENLGLAAMMRSRMGYW